MYEKVDFRHDEERKNAHKAIKRFKVDKKTFERSLKVRKKNEAKRKRRKNVYSTLTRRKTIQKKK